MDKKGICTPSKIAFGTFLLTAGVAAHAANPEAQAFRANYGVVLDGLQQSLTENGNARGLALLKSSRNSLNGVNDETLARLFHQGIPDLSSSVQELQRLSTLSKSRAKSAGLPSASAIIGACDSNPHDSQSVYDAIIASQVTSSVLAAATFVCNEDVLGENAAAGCIPFAIADDIAQGIVAVRQFCEGEEGGAKSDASYDRLDHVHTDLANARSDLLNDASAKLTAILTNSNTNTTTILNNLSATQTAIINNDNANTTLTNNNINANTLSIINNDNHNRDVVVGELRALACEMLRVMTTPDGQKASSIQACMSQPGFPYSWNKK
jgi:hypothetical protein